MKELKRRPSTLYIKLEDDTPYAITWLTSECKMAKLFATELERKEWLRSKEGMSIAIRHRLKHEDKYICRSKIGIVMSLLFGGATEPVYDCYIMGPNKNRLEIKHKETLFRNNSCSDKYGKAKKIYDEVKETLDRAHDKDWECIELRSDLVKLQQDIDRALVLVEEACKQAKNLIRLSKIK